MNLLMGISILVVRNTSQTNQNDLIQRLISEGASVRTEHTIQSAVDSILNHIYHVILCDVQLPEDDGDILIAKISENSAVMPKIIFLARYRERTLMKLYRLGATAVFPESIDIQELVKCIYRLRPVAKVEMARATKRYTYCYDIEVTAIDKNRVVPGKLTDIGIGGMKLNLVNFVPELGEILHFRWKGLVQENPNQAIVGSGVCRWIRLSEGGFFTVGVEFIEPPLTSIYKVIDQIKSMQPTL